MATQKQRLKAHLESGKHITRLSAFHDLGIVELSARVGDLEKDGYPVDRVWITVVNRYKEKVDIKKYFKPIEQQKNQPL